MYFIRYMFSCLILEPVEKHVGHSFKYYDQTQDVFGTKSFKYFFRNLSFNFKSCARILISKDLICFSQMQLYYTHFRVFLKTDLQGNRCQFHATKGQSLCYLAKITQALKNICSFLLFLNRGLLCLKIITLTTYLSQKEETMSSKLYRKEPYSGVYITLRSQ